MRLHERRRDGKRRQIELLPVSFSNRGEVLSGLVADVSDGGIKMVALKPEAQLHLLESEEIFFTIWMREGFWLYSGTVRWASYKPEGCSLGVEFSESFSHGSGVVA